MQHRCLTLPEEARRVVAEQHAAGYDFIKVMYTTSEVFAAIIDEAKKRDLPVAGHVGRLQGVLAAGQASIEHLDGYSQALVASDAPVKHGHQKKAR